MIRAAFIQTSAFSIRALFHYFRRYLEISELGKNKPHQRAQLRAIRRNYAQTSAISRSVFFSFYNCEEVIGCLFVAFILGQLKTEIFSSNEHIYSRAHIYIAMDGEGIYIYREIEIYHLICMWLLYMTIYYHDRTIKW